MENQYRRTSTPLPESNRRKNDSVSGIAFPQADEHEESKFRKYRSLSEGNTIKRLEETFEVFPSLPDAVLEKLGLIGELGNTITEEELEKKFITLALAFTIDAATVKDRRERQRRHRDQTEANMMVEIKKLVDKVNRIQPLCVDAQIAELLTGLLTQIDLVVRASSHATISAERYGAVQHEDRLAESVHLMIKHVTVLKQQRDSIRKQLQYTRRVLQDTNTPSSVPNDHFKHPIATGTNGTAVTKRRASIATFTQMQEIKNTAHNNNIHETRWMIRRTSDFSSRSPITMKASRPNRLELGGDLDKIKEGNVENNQETAAENWSKDEEVDTTESTLKTNGSCDNINNSASHGILQRVRHVFLNLQERYENFESVSSHQLLYYSSLLCFLIALLLLINVFIELKFCKFGYPNLLTIVLNLLFVDHNGG